jgi:hypothetical protein
MDNDEFINRRKHPRHTLSDTVHVVNRATGEAVGAVANLSLEGLMLVNSKPLAVDCIYQLDVTIDGDALGDAKSGARTIQLGVDCLWNSPAADVSAASYWSGCQIIDVSDEDFLLIRRVIDVLTPAQ